VSHAAWFTSYIYPPHANKSILLWCGGIDNLTCSLSKMRQVFQQTNDRCLNTNRTL